MPNNPPAGTPNAVEEARKSLRLNYGLALAGCGMGEADCNEGLASIDALIASVRREVADRMAQENVVLRDAAYQRGRTQAFAEVREVARNIATKRLCTVGRTSLDRSAAAFLVDLNAALDALSSEGK